MVRLVPPAGYPLKMAQVFGALGRSNGSRQSPDSNLSEIAARLGSRFVFGVSSGRAALALVFRSLRRLSPDREIVVLPAYTCFTAAASVVRSGLRLFPAEIEPHTMDFDFSQLEAVPKEGLLCIVTSNLFGIVNDLKRVREIARSKGAWVVDDAAQALGATRDGYSAGTGGDVGVYSLGRGKALPAMEGGLIVTESEDIAAALEEELKQIPRASGSRSAWLFLQMLGFSLFLRPRLYWIPNAMPFLNLGATEFAPDFAIAGLSPMSHALLRKLIESPVDANKIRRANAAALAEALSTGSIFSTPKPSPDCLPTYIRFPVIARDQATRDQAVSKLRDAGIGAGSFYPSAICDIPGIERHMAPRDYHRPKAESLSQRLFTVPTHHYVNRRDLDRCIAVLKSF